MSNTNTNNDNTSLEGADTFSRKLHNTVDFNNSNISQLPVDNNDVVWKKILVHTTLIRDSKGLGFTIAGSTNGIFISKITVGGVAHRDGKLQVNDTIKSVRFSRFYLF